MAILATNPYVWCVTPGWSAGWAGGGGGGHAGPAGRPAGAGHQQQPWRQHPGPRRHQGPGHPAGDRAAGECSTILTSIYIVHRYSQYSEHKKKLQLVCEGVPITKYSEFLYSSMQCNVTIRELYFRLSTWVWWATCPWPARRAGTPWTRTRSWSPCPRPTSRWRRPQSCQSRLASP